MGLGEMKWGERELKKIKKNGLGRNELYNHVAREQHKRKADLK